MRLSVLMPVYNEMMWIETIVQRVVEQKIPGIRELELIVVDDASGDGTKEKIQQLCLKYPKIIKPVFHPKNRGKGAAIRTAINHMTGEICIIQDADLEYDPKDYPLILEPIIDGRADCVYGSRFIGSQAKRVLYFWHYVANKMITLCSDMFTNLNLTDVETGFKAFRCDLLKTIPLRSDGFEIEPEITAKIARRKCRVYEVGISYSGRTYQEGKKITFKDAFTAIWTILKYTVVDDSRL